MQFSFTKTRPNPSDLFTKWIKTKNVNLLAMLIQLLKFFLLFTFQHVIITPAHAYCEVGSVNFVRTSNVRPLDSILQQIPDRLSISSLRCHQTCIDSINCTGYLYDRKQNECYLLVGDRLRINHQNLIRSPDWSYHRRICLTTDSICSQAWAFESFGAAQLHSIADKIMWNLNSEENCLNACSSERQFICRSAIYDHTNKSCSLHSSDRHTVPDMLAAADSLAASNLLYMENHCIQQGCEIWRTHFELMSGVRLIGRVPFKRLLNHQPAQCIQMCKQDESCRSLTVDYETGSCEFFGDPQPNDQMTAELLQLGSRLAKRSAQTDFIRSPDDARRIVARLNVSDLNLEADFSPVEDVPDDDDMSIDHPPATFLPEPNGVGGSASPGLAWSSSTEVSSEASTASSSPLWPVYVTTVGSTLRLPTTLSTTTPTTTTTKTSTTAAPVFFTTTASTTPKAAFSSFITSSNLPSSTSLSPMFSHSFVPNMSHSTSATRITSPLPSSTSSLSSTLASNFTSRPLVSTFRLPALIPISTSSIPITFPLPTTTMTTTTTSTTPKPVVRPSVTPIAIPSNKPPSSLSPNPITPVQPISHPSNQITKTPSSNFPSQKPQQSHSDADELQPCSQCAYFTKVCLSELNSCGTDWTFELKRGFWLETRRPANARKPEENADGFLSEQMVEKVANRADCQSECLKVNRLHVDGAKKPSSNQFVCRAAAYDSQLQQCRLYSYTRHSTYGKYVKLLPAQPYLEYMENNCLAGDRGFCTWKSQRRLRLQQADRVYQEANLTACQDRCTTASAFYCRSVSFEQESGLCALSHHSGRSFTDPEQILQTSPTAVFSEIGNCFTVSVECGATEMWAKVNSLTLFHGRAYARDRPSTCSTDVRNAVEFSLPIQLNGESCGTKQQPEADFLNVLVIQANDQVLTAVDKAIGLRCSYNVHNITGEATLQFSDLDLTDQSRSSAALPELSLHITDLRGLDREEVNLGELLKVQVRLSEEDTYGIFVRNLIAKDPQGVHNLTLIDHSGCPAHSKLMREMRTLGGGSKQLESYFEAFSFTGSSHLNLEAEVETCLDTCRPVQCQIANARSDDDYETVTSFGRRRRRRKRESNVLGTKKLSQSLIVKSARLGVGTSGTDRLIRKHSLADGNSFPIDSNGVATGATDAHLPTSTLARTGIAEMNSVGDFCFGLSSLAAFSGLTMLVQSIFFFVAALLINRVKTDRTASRAEPPTTSAKRCNSSTRSIN